MRRRPTRASRRCTPGSSRQSTAAPQKGRRSRKAANASSRASRLPWWSRCSASTLVTTAITGARCRKEPSLSSASATRKEPRPEPRAAALALRARADHAPAHHDGRVEARHLEHVREERGGRRLAVGAGDGDAVLEPHHLGQHLGARDHGTPRRSASTQLRVAPAHRGRHHHDVGALRRGARRGRSRRRRRARGAAPRSALRARSEPVTW